MSTRYRYTSMGSERVIERPMIDHRSKDYAPNYRPMSDARRRDIFGDMQPMVEPYDYRKGTIRGFAAMILVVAVLFFAGVMF